MIGKSIFSLKLLRGGATHSDLFYHIISPENLLLAWREFKRGKAKKIDIQEFDFYLEENIFKLHNELKNKTYKPSPYIPFYVCDPKRRHIHKACVRDRVVHQALFRIISPIFEKSFIYDSFSCRKYKGTHAGVERLENFLRQSSKNYSQITYALKCDISKFFDSIDHCILKNLLRKKITDNDVFWLLEIIIDGFEKKSKIYAMADISNSPLLAIAKSGELKKRASSR
ncbi:MAG: reverse transcriptase domain-containing protein [Candidatus Nomurabacteria bacterium]|nr:reverse transcriptase domain-containing protein [Candidatus Nomurabacteria bacterium]